jgi:hypothetical protein
VNYITLPNFFILGAAKAGTTTLYDLLHQHSQIYLSFVKEPMFFSHDDNYARGLEWYQATFFRDCAGYPARGEATPHYLYWAEKVAPRLARTVGAGPVKFIVIFRDPLQRAYSWYWNMVKEGKETLPFAEALEAEPARLQEHWSALQHAGSMIYGYYRGSSYASQLRVYLDQFPRENFLFLIQEDLKKDFGATLLRTFDFLEVDPQSELQPIASNPAALPRNRSLHRIVQGPSGLKRLIKRIVPFSWRYRLKLALIDANMKPFEYPPLEQPIASALRARFSDEVQRLSSMIDRDLSHWLAPR